MKPTQQEIIELAREAGFEFDKATKYEPASLLNRAKHDIHAFQRFATLLLERFGAGGGEPVARLLTWIGKGTYPKKGYTVARTYEECPKDAYPDDWEEGPELYTHPSPESLRAEYVRGLEEGFKEGWIECSKWAQRDDLIADIGSPSYEACVSAVKALKGKQ